MAAEQLVSAAGLLVEAEAATAFDESTGIVMVALCMSSWQEELCWLRRKAKVQQRRLGEASRGDGGGVANLTAPATLRAQDVVTVMV